jgi:acetyl esterase/lipase
MRTLAPLIAAFFAMSATAQDRVIRLYDGPAPGSEHWKQSEQENNHNQWQTRVVYNVADPTLTVLLPEPEKAIGTGIVICPGGAFHALSIDSEGLDVARWLKDRGVACFVLKYRLVECQTQDPTQEIMTKTSLEKSVMPVVPLALADGLAAVGHVRRHANEYAVRPDRIGILGFSAGGTVAAAVAYNYQSENRPDFVAPIYLAYSWVPRKAVPADAPPMFILGATDDPLGLAPQSVALYRDWTAAGKSAELVLYAKGGHGFGMRKQNLPSDRWIERFAEWLGAQGWLSSVVDPREGEAPTNPEISWESSGSK